MNSQPHLKELDQRLDKIHASRLDKIHASRLDKIHASRLDKIHASRSQKHNLKTEIKQRFGGTCAYCGCTPRVLTVDHIVPQTQGGLNVRSNLAAVCQRCNRSKGSRPLWSWWQASSCWNEERAIQFAATVLVCKIATLPSENIVHPLKALP